MSLHLSRSFFHPRSGQTTPFPRAGRFSFSVLTVLLFAAFAFSIRAEDEQAGREEEKAATEASASTDGGSGKENSPSSANDASAAQKTASPVQAVFRSENARILVSVTLFSAVLVLALLAYIVVLDHHRRRMLKLLRAVFKQIPSRIVVGSRNGTAHFIHVGKFGEDSGFVHFPVNELPEYADETFRHAWEEVFATGETQKFQMATGNRHRSVEMALFDDKDAFGHDTAFWISHDIEELLQAQNELKAGLDNQEKLNSLFDASLKMLSGGGSAVDTTNDVLSFIVSSVKEHLKADRCFIMRYDFSKDRMEIFAGDVFGDLGSRTVEKRFIPFPENKDETILERLRDHQPVVVNDFLAAFFTAPDAQPSPGGRPRKVGACFSPVFIDGKLWGHLGAVYLKKGRHDRFSDQHIQFLQGVAHVA